MSLENNNKNDGSKKEKKSFYQIMDKQGFYIILLLCVAIVAATAMWVNNQREDYFIGDGPDNLFESNEEPEVTLVDEDSDQPGSSEAQTTGRIGEGKPKENEEKPSAGTQDKPENKENSSDTLKDKPEEGKNIKEKTEKDTEEKDKEENKEEANIIQTMAVPVVGKLGLAFADDHLVYHKTLDHWSTHKGIDIHATEGTPVKAALDGEVVEVINDTVMGITITIKHDGDIFTRYSNLSTDAMVKVGEKVEKGQTISGVGKTASVKALEGPLLHFQVLKDDKLVDPQIYIGKLNK